MNKISLTVVFVGLLGCGDNIKPPPRPDARVYLPIDAPRVADAQNMTDAPADSPAVLVDAGLVSDACPCHDRDCDNDTDEGHED